MPGKRVTGMDNVTAKNREVVRVKMLDEALEKLQLEIGQRSAHVIDQILVPRLEDMRTVVNEHAEHLQNLRTDVSESNYAADQRLQRLEMLPWNRLGLWLGERWAALRFWWATRRADGGDPDDRSH